MLKYQIILMIVVHSKQFSNSDMLKEIPPIMFHKHHGLLVLTKFGILLF